MHSRCVLVVEDEMCLAMMLEDLLSDSGYRVVLASRVQEAQRLVDEESIDAAILDVNVNGEQAYPVAERLRERGVPFLFASATAARAFPPSTTRIRCWPSRIRSPTSSPCSGGSRNPAPGLGCLRAKRPLPASVQTVADAAAHSGGILVGP